MKNVLGNAISLFVIIIVLLLIIPLSPFVLDVMFILNISLVILLITMNIRESLEFSIFPSLLLITTLLRLGLNISSTRLILTKQGEAGAVIKAFGNFVLQGNIIVGVIIFLIIVLVQFIVITKGAERVAEVAARFTLDAMPGKQMAIDADLSSGLINEEEARTRRYKIQKEADFYGAMDGATKIVKGDAVMSIIITLINFIAGTIIGIVQSGMPFTDVIQIYSIATIGDGLVSQIPALLISTATGMIVTRAVSDGSLNNDVSSQFMAQPTALIIAGILMGVLAVMPGAPHLQLAIIAAALIGLGMQVRNKSATAELPVELPAEEGPIDENAHFKDINNIYPLLNIEPIEMEFGYSLIPLVDEESGGKLINRIVIFRRQYAQDMGFVVPSIRLRDSSALNTNQYIINIKGEEIARGEILTDYYLALEPSAPVTPIDGIETIEPAYGIPGKWITADKKEMAEIYGYTVIDPLSVMVMALKKVHVAEKLEHEGCGRPVVDLLGRAALFDAAVVEDHDPVRDLHRLLLVVGDEDAGDMHLVMQPAQPAPQLLAHLRWPLLRKLGPPDQQLHLLMDQSCEGNQTRHLALALGYVPVVPSSAKRFDPWEYDRAMYRRRNEFERLFRRLKGYRRILSRWEKLDLMFTGFINFALVTDEAWLVLKQLFRRHQSFGPRCRPKRLVALCLGMRSSVLFQQIPTQAPLARRAHAKACGLLLDDQIRFTQSAK